MTEERNPKPCKCAAFLRACEPGTDSECYGVEMGVGAEWEWGIGTGLPPIKFCPWCGVLLWPGKGRESVIESTEWCETCALEKKAGDKIRSARWCTCEP